MYQNAGVYLKKDAQEGALATGRRVSKGLKGNQYGDKASSKGHVYYEYRANRLDVKQPKGKQKYPKLAEGGYMAKGGETKVAKFKVEDMVYSYQNKDYAAPINYVKFNPWDSNSGTHPNDTYKYRLSLKDGHSNWIDEKSLYKTKQKEYAKGGYMAKGGEVEFIKEGNKLMYFEPINGRKDIVAYINDSSKDVSPSGVYFIPHPIAKDVVKWCRKNGYEFIQDDKKYAKGGMVSLNEHYKSLGKKEDLVGLKVYDKNNEEFIYIKDVDSGIFAGKNKNDELGHNYRMSDLMVDKMAEGGYMAKGGMSQGYDDREDERLSMEHGKISSKDLDSTHARRDDARFEERMAKGGYYAEGGITKDKLIEIEEEFDENEDNNYHSENVVLLARYFGTKEDLKEAKDIWKKHREEGYLNGENSKKRYELSMKLYKNWDKEKEKFGLMAKGGKLIGKQKNLDVNENGKLDAEDFKMLRKQRMAEGGITEKEVVDSNAQMVLSQIKAVKHHADELSQVVSRNSDIEAWVVAKIERASTDLSDITHYLDGQHEKMSMGGSVYHHAHKMDKK